MTSASCTPRWVVPAGSTGLWGLGQGSREICGTSSCCKLLGGGTAAPLQAGGGAGRGKPREEHQDCPHQPQLAPLGDLPHFPLKHCPHPWERGDPWAAELVSCRGLRFGAPSTPPTRTGAWQRGWERHQGTAVAFIPFPHPVPLPWASHTSWRPQRGHSSAWM